MDIIMNDLEKYFIEECHLNEYEARELALLNNQLCDELHRRIVNFSFKKQDGSIRKAIGTLMTDSIPKTESKRTIPFDLQVYFDVEKSQYRSFKKLNLLSVE